MYRSGLGVEAHVVSSMAWDGRVENNVIPQVHLTIFILRDIWKVITFSGEKGVSHYSIGWLIRCSYFVFKVSYPFGE